MFITDQNLLGRAVPDDFGIWALTSIPADPVPPNTTLPTRAEDAFAIRHEDLQTIGDEVSPNNGNPDDGLAQFSSSEIRGRRAMALFPVFCTGAAAATADICRASGTPVNA